MLVHMEEVNVELKFQARAGLYTKTDEVSVAACWLSGTVKIGVWYSSYIAFSEVGRFTLINTCCMLEISCTVNRSIARTIPAPPICLMYLIGKALMLHS